MNEPTVKLDKNGTLLQEQKRKTKMMNKKLI